MARLMSGEITTVEARERIYALLWPKEGVLDSDTRIAIAENRLWRALRDQRFSAQENGRQLELDDLTEVTRQRFFSSNGFTINEIALTKWLRTASPLNSWPKGVYLTAVEATMFLAFGAFLCAHDIAAVEFFETRKSAKTIGVTDLPEDTRWDTAIMRLFDAAGSGKLTLLGRLAPQFGADPIGAMVQIPREFFAANVTLGLFNGIYERDHAERVTYCEVVIRTSEFRDAFVSASTPIQIDSKDAPSTTRQPTKKDTVDFREWAQKLYHDRGFGPSLKEAFEFAKKRRLSREWSRKIYKDLPSTHRRLHGGKGTTKRLLKL
jgi:hypothetical protein